MLSLRRTISAWLVALLSTLASNAHGQKTDTTVVPGPGYDAGSLKQLILGSGWRDLWTTPVNVPFFNIDTFAGGLKVDKRGGGFQSVTLHLTEQNGWQEWRFRSVDKYPELNLPPELKGTAVGRIIEDQTGNLFPAAGAIVPPFMAAVGGLHVDANLYVMQDNGRLAPDRKLFAGMLGTVELKPEEGPHDTPGFAKSTKIKDTEGFLEDFVKDRGNRIDEREFLALRMVDFLVNDTDRTPDNIDWARFGEKGNYLWRAIERDSDRAFTNGTGLVNRLFVRRVYPKFTMFNSHYSLRGLTSSSYTFDRRFLQRLTRQDFADVAAKVQQAISDEVIAEALAELPPEWRARQPGTVEHVRETLVARRAGLADFAMKFYEDLAAEPDIHLTDDPERADIVRHPNGQVTVTVAGISPRPRIVAETRDARGGATRVMGGEVDLAPPAFYQRTFLPSETKDIRVYLGKGIDTAVVRGANNDSILVRVIGGAGDDVLADSVDHGAERFYDAEGKNRVLTSDTEVDTRAWQAPSPTFGFTIGGAWRPDWGERRGVSPVVKYGEDAGLIVGAGPQITSFGFRRLPYHWRAGAALLVGTGNGRLGVTTNADYRAENSPVAFAMTARATQLDAYRFYGYGNDTPDIGRDLSLVNQTVIAAEPSVVWHVGWRGRETRGGIMEYNRPKTTDTTGGRRPVVGTLSIGPRVQWAHPNFTANAPITAVEGNDDSGHIGAGIGVDLDGTDTDPVPLNGWKLRGSAAVYPFGLQDGAFTSSAGDVSAYMHLVRGSSVAVRLGGSFASGDFPAQYSAFIGGSSTVRGYAWRRFSGDRAALGSAELRVPLGKLNFLVRSNVGAIALMDAGRVWFDGQSDGGWHSGLGGGLWFAALGRAVSVTYAHGDEHRFYLNTGLPF
jgi:hypothetical protein